MATFLELYGNLLDEELGTEDRTERFTTARRKAAVNDAQSEWVRLTESFTQEAQIDLVEGIQEYDLEEVIGDDAFLRFGNQMPYVQITTPSGVSYVDGDSFPREDIPRLDRAEPGWRRAPRGRPQSWYRREDRGRVFFGIHPPPDVKAGETWLLFVPFISYAARMVDDTDEPFAASQPGGNPKRSLRAYHHALVHFAAARLEKLRRNYEVSGMQMAAFQRFVDDYLGDRRERGGNRVTFQRNYFQDARGGVSRPPDPRRF